MSKYKRCSMCKKSKPATLKYFYAKERKGESDGLTVRCRDCTKAAAAASQASDRERTRLKLKRWREANPDRVREHGRRMNHVSRFRQYGLTELSYKAMLRKQRGRCAICRKPVDNPHIDHNHKTGVVRGLLCPPCNLGLGCFKDNPKVLDQAARYLRGL